MAMTLCFNFSSVEAGGIASKFKRKKHAIVLQSSDEEPVEKIVIVLPEENEGQVTQTTTTSISTYVNIYPPVTDIGVAPEGSSAVNTYINVSPSTHISYNTYSAGTEHVGREVMLAEKNIKSLDKLQNKLQKISNPEDVTSLYLRYNQLTKIPACAFSRFCNLRHLYLDNNEITTLDPHAFFGLDDLTELDLSNNQLKTLPENVFASLQSITHLNMQGNQISVAREEDFKHSHHLPEDMYLFL
jgi:Leucine-rich repeat (LRR) protein